MSCVKSQLRIPVNELFQGLNPLGVERGTFAVLVLNGYIDESLDRDGELFNLSCLIGHGSDWFYLEQDWMKVLDAKNRELHASGRKPISRYHATDCSTRHKEFEGWSVEEEREFTKHLLAIFNNYRLDVVGLTINLRELVDYVPETKPNPTGFAYVTLLWNMLVRIGEGTLTRQKDTIISLIHEHCDYDAAMLQAFNVAMADSQFKHRNRFVSLTAMGWRHCTPLQPTDLIAYENMKESERHTKTTRDRRKSLAAILQYGQMGGRLYGVNKEGLLHFRDRLGALDDTTKQLLLRTAGIHQPQPKKNRTNRVK
jgi:hypothetical protein